MAPVHAAASVPDAPLPSSGPPKDVLLAHRNAARATRLPAPAPAPTPVYQQEPAYYAPEYQAAPHARRRHEGQFYGQPEAAGYARGRGEDYPASSPAYQPAEYPEGYGYETPGYPQDPSYYHQDRGYQQGEVYQQGQAYSGAAAGPAPSARAVRTPVARPAQPPVIQPLAARRVPVRAAAPVSRRVAVPRQGTPARYDAGEAYGQQYSEAQPYPHQYDAAQPYEYAQQYPAHQYDAARGYEAEQPYDYASQYDAARGYDAGQQYDAAQYSPQPGYGYDPSPRLAPARRVAGASSPWARARAEASRLTGSLRSVAPALSPRRPVSSPPSAADRINPVAVIGLIVAVVSLVMGYFSSAGLMLALVALELGIFGIVRARHAKVGKPIAVAATAVAAFAIAAISAWQFWIQPMLEDAASAKSDQAAAAPSATTVNTKPAAGAAEAGQGTDSDNGRNPTNAHAYKFGVGAFTYSDGVGISVSSPEAFTPSDEATAKKYPHYLKFEVKITNPNDSDLAVDMFPLAATSDGLPAEGITDEPNGMDTQDKPTVKAGGELVIPVGFGVADDKDLELDISPSAEVYKAVPFSTRVK